jgi:ankyrin repeat protein
VVTFTHASAADYITERLAGIDAELDIANTSLGYLSMDCLLEPDTRSPKQAPYYFLDYAMSFWSAHAAKAHDSVQLDNLLAFAKKSPSALAETAKWNLKDALHHLLEAGVSPNEVYCESSPLAIAASHGHLLCASYLVEAGAHVDYAGSERRPVDTALTLAVLSEYSQIIVLLIDSNADLNAGPVPPLIATIFNGNLDIAKQLLAAGCDPDVRYNGRSAIIVALDQNRMDIAEALMSGGADLNAFHGIGGETPLSTAIGYRRWEFALKLIERGSGLTDGTCLIQSMKHAASEGSEEVVRALLKLVDLDESSPTNEIGKDDIASMPAAAVAQICKKPLHHALEARKHGIAELLIDARSGINQVCGVPPYTALEWAAGRDDVALVKKLLFAGADPNLGGQVMPLMSAASRFVSANNCSDTKSTRIIALLLDAGADPHARGGKALSSLTVRVRENIRFGWWSKDDATVQRLLITLQLPEDWFVT